MTTQTKWFVIGSGPSLQKKDVDLLQGMNVIVINDNYLLAPWAPVLYACDAHWWEWHHQKPELLNFKGERWTQEEGWDDPPGRKERLTKLLDLKFIKSINAPGLSTDPKIIYQGSNSGIQAINLAYHFGAKDIFLLGFDMQNGQGKSHWFGEHPNNVHPNYERVIPLFQSVADKACEINLNIVNISRVSALKCFKRDSLENVMRG